MATMEIDPDFTIATRNGAVRVSFQFSAVGNKQSGVLYITTSVAADADLMVEAAKAAKIAAKRAGADVVTLHRIVPPVR